MMEMGSCGHLQGVGDSCRRVFHCLIEGLERAGMYEEVVKVVEGEIFEVPESWCGHFVVDTGLSLNPMELCLKGIFVWGERV